MRGHLATNTLNGTRIPTQTRGTRCGGQDMFTWDIAAFTAAFEGFVSSMIALIEAFIEAILASFVFV